MWKLFNKIEERTILLLFLLFTIVITIQVIFRYFISYSLAWSEELARYFFIATVYLGISYVERYDGHLSINILRTNGGKFLGKYLPILVSCISIAISSIVAYWGYNMVLFVYETQELSPSMEIPIAWMYFCIPIGFICMTIHSIANLVTYCKKTFNINSEEGK